MIDIRFAESSQVFSFETRVSASFLGRFARLKRSREVPFLRGEGFQWGSLCLIFMSRLCDVRRPRIVGGWSW